MPFVIGDYSIDWENAEESSLPHLSSVDVPTETEFVYFVGRYDANGELYTVRADSKIIVVKESDNDAIMTYVRTTIPDAFYADVFYDQNICDLTLNCDDRVDYWGLEYYSTLDGCPIAVAKYENGECVASVYLKDETRTIENRIAAFGRLMGNTWVIRRPAEQTRVTGDGNWNYGDPLTTFYGTDGTLYIYLDHNGDGKSDSITTWALYQEMYNNTDTSNGGGGGSNNQTPPYSPPDPFVPTNNGGDGNLGGDGNPNASGGGDKDNSNGEGDPDDKQEGEQDPIVVDTLENDTLPRDTLSNPTDPKLPAEVVNPLPAPKVEPEEERCEVCGFVISECICPKEKDCDEIAPEASENSNVTTNLYDSMSVKNGYLAYKNTFHSDPSFEYGVTAVLDTNYCMQITPVYTDYKINSITPKFYKKPLVNISISHNHPQGSPFSLEDVFTLAEGNRHYNQFDAMYVETTIGVTYAIYVFDGSKSSQLAIDKMRQESLRANYDYALSVLASPKYKGQYDNHTRQLYAISYALEVVDVGIAILSKNVNELKFHQHQTVAKGCDEFDIPNDFELIKCISL